MSLCHVGQHRDLPDTGGICCWGAAEYGPHRCTCWLPVYDREQTPPVPADPVVRPDGMCGDCAYRPGSPEKRGDPDHAGDADQLEDLAAGAGRFFCHDGIRRPTKLVHPSGVEIPGHAADYDPPIRDGVPYRADGTPGFLCAGWDARRRALAAQWARHETPTGEPT